MIETPNPIPDNCLFSSRHPRPSCAASCNSVTCRLAFGPADERPKITRTRALHSAGVAVPEQAPAPRGTPPGDSTVIVTTISGQRCVSVPFAKLGKRLTADGEVALLGSVHNYLGVWAARAAAGEVTGPVVGGFTYGWDGGYSALEFPVLAQDAKNVQAQVREILARPETTQPINSAPADEPRRGEKGSKMARPVLTNLIDGKECLSLAAAAEMKGVSRQAILVRIKRGTLDHVRVADRLYVPLEALKGWGWDAAEPRGGEEEPQ